ncbi:TerD family protein [Streptomyces sp. PT12]|uniref:TerD family protein n=1 Tax=Streptomyces sp. PT12 TaxID=1510197 RepID=UPI000DE2A026|nr:TerD family protein [Streptomyces sp. PT12]RBM14939.1 TerD-family protein [Streptomyces sp. PT12]
MSGASRGIARAEVMIKWDPSPAGEASRDVDIIAGVFRKDDPFGAPVYVVHPGRRSPDGTITVKRESRTGQGFGYDEVMAFEFDRMSSDYVRVVVGVAVQQAGGARTLGEAGNPRVRVVEGHDELVPERGLPEVAGALSATVGEFTRDGAGPWAFAASVRGFDADPEEFARVMGRRPA